MLSLPNRCRADNSSASSACRHEETWNGKQTQNTQNNPSKGTLHALRPYAMLGVTPGLRLRQVSRLLMDALTAQLHNAHEQHHFVLWVLEMELRQLDRTRKEPLHFGLSMGLWHEPRSACQSYYAACTADNSLQTSFGRHYDRQYRRIGFVCVCAQCHTRNGETT